MSKRLSKIIIFLFLFFILILIVLKQYQCPIKFVFGLSCPTCGITRAILSALQLDFTKAFYYHMFWPIVVVGLIAYTLYKLKILKVNRNQMIMILCIICIANLVYYFYRLFNNSEIVYFAFNESLIYKVYKLIMH